MEETVILHFDIDEQPAVQSIKDLRAANTELRKSRDGVNIATKEGQELVQKLNVAIDKNNATIKANSSALEKQRQNVGNYTNSIKDAANELNIMGVNVGQVTSKIASFANPGTAAVGILTALGAAYARSSIGAKDLEFAQNQLSFAIDMATDSFARLFSSVEDGEGIVSQFLNSLLFRIDSTTAILSNIAARAREDIQTVREEQALADEQISERLAQNAELMTDIANKELEIEKRKNAVLTIQENITANTNEQLGFINREIDALEIIRGTTADKGDLDLQINKLIAQRAKLVTNESRQREKVQKQLNALLAAEANEQEKILAAILKRQQAALKNIGNTKGPITEAELISKAYDKATESQRKNVEARIKITDTLDKHAEKFLKDQEARDKKEAESAKELADRKSFLKEQELMQAANLAGALSALLGEQTELGKAAALTQIGLNTAEGISAATKAGAGIPWPGNLAAILSGITAVLAGITQAKSVIGFAEGGWTGPGGKYQPVGVVHADEYVVPKHINNYAPAQPHIAALESYRTKGYADGGFVANTNMEGTRNALMMANILKNLPPGEVSVVEINRVNRRVIAKENISRV